MTVNEIFKQALAGCRVTVKVDGKRDLVMDVTDVVLDIDGKLVLYDGEHGYKRVELTAVQAFEVADEPVLQAEPEAKPVKVQTSKPIAVKEPKGGHQISRKK